MGRGPLLEAVLLLALLVVLPGCPGRPARPAGGYAIHLVAVGRRPAAVVAAVVSIRGGTMEVARGLVAHVGSVSLPIETGLSEAEARRGVADLERAGARAVVVPLH